MKDEIRRSGRSEVAILTEELQRSVAQAEREREKAALQTASGDCKETQAVPKEGTKGRSRSQAAFRERQETRSRELQEPLTKEGTEEADWGDGVSKKKSFWKPAVGLFLALLIAAGGAYIYKAMSFKNTYLPHTLINGMDVTGRTAEEVKGLMAAGVKDYRLDLLLREGGSEAIKGTDINLHTVFDGSLEEIIHQQNPYAWPRYLIKGPSYEIQTMIAFEEEKLDKVLGDLNCFDSSQVEPPGDASLSDYITGQGYTIIPGTEGNQLDEALVKEAVSHGIMNLVPKLNLEELGCYRTAGMEDQALIAARDARNAYVNISVTYTFGNRTQVLDGELIHQWLVIDGDSVTLDQEMVAEYVKELAKANNTAYTKRLFKTSYGSTVEVSGFYGWRINQEAEVQELMRILESGESVVREPVYSQTAASHDGPDYGSTYAEVNLTAQHLFFYKEGEMILESDFVSGNTSRGHTTPPGLFGLTYKQRDAVLKGEGYRSPVKFWMPFNGGIGFHDASWRSSFGGSIYKTGGSHGCINMPYEAAKTLFEHVYAGMPVICYNLPGTEAAGSSQSSGKAPAAAPVPTTAPAPALPQETLPAEVLAPETLPAETPSSQTQPEISIQTEEQTTEVPEGGSQPSETTAGYGPAFAETTAGGEVGPGVQ